MKAICPICYKPFQITKNGKLNKHGYSYKIVRRSWNGLFEIKKNYRIKIKPPCIGSGKQAKNIVEE